MSSFQILVLLLYNVLFIYLHLLANLYLFCTFYAGALLVAHWVESTSNAGGIV